MIKNRIEDIKEYFKEMQIVTVDNKHIIYVIVNFPNNWVIDDTIEDNFNVKISKGNYENEYYFFTEIDNGEDKIFDAINYNIKKMKAAIERANLLKNKMIELRNLFENEIVTLDELKNLKFVYNTNNITAEVFKNEETILDKDTTILTDNIVKEEEFIEKQQKKNKNIIKN